MTAERRRCSVGYTPMGSMAARATLRRWRVGWRGACDGAALNGRSEARVRLLMRGEVGVKC